MSTAPSFPSNSGPQSQFANYIRLQVEIADDKTGFAELSGPLPSRIDLKSGQPVPFAVTVGRGSRGLLSNSYAKWELPYENQVNQALGCWPEFPLENADYSAFHDGSVQGAEAIVGTITLKAGKALVDYESATLDAADRLKKLSISRTIRTLSGGKNKDLPCLYLTLWLEQGQSGLVRLGKSVTKV
jgi:hypothetical protein